MLDSSAIAKALGSHPDGEATPVSGGCIHRCYHWGSYFIKTNSDAPNLHEIYNLYHVLNHALLFGGSYVAQAGSIIRRLA